MAKGNLVCDMRTSTMLQPTPNVLGHEPSFLRSPTTTHEVNGSSNEPHVDSDRTQWEPGSMERDRSEMPGYVNLEATEPFGLPLSGNAGSGWNFPNSTGINPFNEGYPEFLEDHGRTQGGFPLTPSRNNLHPGFSLPSDFSGYEPWTGSQESRPRNTDPD